VPLVCVLSPLVLVVVSPLVVDPQWEFFVEPP
jgi:hypothetical protein